MKNSYWHNANSLKYRLNLCASIKTNCNQSLYTKRGFVVHYESALLLPIYLLNHKVNIRKLMKDCFIAQRNSLTTLVKDICNCLQQEQSYSNREQYSMQTELNLLEYALTKHLTQERVSQLNQERVITFLRQYFNISQTATLTNDEDKSIVN